MTEAAQQEIVEEFSFFETWEDKYSYLIDLGKDLEPYPEEFRNDDFRVTGCQSRVWLHPTFKDGKVHYQGDSDAAIVKGLVALALKVYSGNTPEDILATEPSFLHQIGLDSHLSPNRANGFASMIKSIKLYAVGFSSPSQQ